jgi:hypothetical protein
MRMGDDIFIEEVRMRTFGEEKKGGVVEVRSVRNGIGNSSPS